MAYVELKKAEGKRHSPSALPYRESKGKETRPGYCCNPLRPRACARGRYTEAGAAADEILSLFGDPSRDRGTWAFYCYHFDIEDILDKAREINSMWRQHELRDPVSAFQKWLGKKFPKKV